MLWRKVQALINSTALPAKWFIEGANGQRWKWGGEAIRHWHKIIIKWGTKWVTEIGYFIEYFPLFPSRVVLEGTFRDTIVIVTFKPLRLSWVWLCPNHFSGHSFKLIIAILFGNKIMKTEGKLLYSKMFRWNISKNVKWQFEYKIAISKMKYCKFKINPNYLINFLSALKQA